METQPANSAVRLDTRCCAGLPGEPRISSLAGKVAPTLDTPSRPLQGCWGAGQGGGFWDGCQALP